jgi:type III secretion protein J
MAKLLFVVSFLFLCCGCKEKIVHDLRETEANRVLGVLQDSLIDAQKEQQSDGRWSILVSDQDVSLSLKYLHKSRVLRRAEGKAQSSSSVMSSIEDQRFHFERSLSREIENTLLGIDGVLDARVHLHLVPTDPVFGRPLPGARKGSGSVLLVVKTNAAARKEEIAQLVAGASGLTDDVISVLTTGMSVEGIQQVPRAVPGSSEEPVAGIDEGSITRHVRKFPLAAVGIASVLLFIGCWQIIRLFGIRVGG